MTETTDARKRRLEGERVAGDAVAEVLAAHLFTIYPGEIACDCDWTAKDDTSRAGDNRMIAAHVAHVAAQVAPLLDQARAEGAAGITAAVQRERAKRNRLRAAVEALADEVEYAHIGRKIRAVLADADNEAGEGRD